MHINLTFERDTKNTVRFAEDTENQPEDHPGAPVLGTMYMQKFAYVKLGKPEHITVEIAVPQP